MKKVMLVFGTRPEAIKMCPLVKELRTRPGLQTVVCVTGQHRQMLDMVLETFGVKPEYDLDIMKDRQTLFDVGTGILEGIRPVLEGERPQVGFGAWRHLHHLLYGPGLLLFADSCGPCGGGTAHL